jgi:transcriptional regulator with XRE-family HTH domain
MATSDQLRAARAILGLSQPDVAKAAGVSTMTLKRAEGSGQPPASAEAIAAIRAALETAGVVFLDQDNGGPGVRLAPEKARSRPPTRGV